jgi:hypothetical protein
MGLAPTCGASANESCCLVKPVEGGTFYRSFDGAGFNDMSAPATVSAFVLDRYEVTVGRFRAFVEAGQGTQASPPAVDAGVHPHLTGSGWDSAWNTSLVAEKEALISAVQREQADELRDVVRGDGVLHLGRWLPADGSRVELRGERRQRAARVPVVASGQLGDHRLQVRELRPRDALRRRSEPRRKRIAAGRWQVGPLGPVR